MKHLSIISISLIITDRSFATNQTEQTHPSTTCETKSSHSTICKFSQLKEGLSNAVSPVIQPESQQRLKTMSFPKMPEKIRAILHQDWNVLDPRGKEMLSRMAEMDHVVEFAHGTSTFYKHLKGTFGLLSAWGQPEVVRRTGLAHTSYSGDLFAFYLFDSNEEAQRNVVRELLGEESEALTYLFGTIDRGTLCNFKELINNERNFTTCPSGDQTVAIRSKDLNFIDINPRDSANILMVTIADYLDQMVDTNGWKDHHQVEDNGHRLYPGDGKPDIGFFWFSAICKAIRGNLEVIPPIFNYCEDVILKEDEIVARDAYWKVILQEENMTEKDQIELLQEAIFHNKFIAEPHLMIAQIYYRQENYHGAMVEARSCLEKFYTLATCWDKRRSYEQWIGFARVLLLRAIRKVEGKEHSFPFSDPENPLYVNHNKLNLTSLEDVVLEMKWREERHNQM